MSDRVAIIGGSEVGRDHFPFPVADADPNSTLHTVTTDLTNACRWFYLTKKWNFDCQIAYTFWNFEGDPPEWVANNGFCSIDFDFIIKVNPNSLNPDDWFAPTKESDLVLPQAIGSGLSFQLTPDNVFTIINTGDGFPLEISNVSTEVINAFGRTNIALCTLFFRTSGSSIPDVNMEWLNEAYPFTPALQLQVTVGDNATLFDLNVDTGHIIGGGFTIGGASAGVNFYSNATSHKDEATSCTCFIGASEFWPYATKNGSPVYNPGDGSVINDPLS